MDTEALKGLYEERIVDYLRLVGEAMRRNGYTEAAKEPEDYSDEEYEWWLTLDALGHALRFTIMEERVNEDPEGTGITFALQADCPDGYLMGTVIPHNYTDQCWVPIGLKDAIEERFQETTSCPPEDWVAELDEHLDDDYHNEEVDGE